MLHVEVQTKRLSILLTNIGGLWTAINALTFIFFSFFMFERMLETQARIIARRQDPEGRPDNDQVDRIQWHIRERLSFVNLYQLFDEVSEVNVIFQQRIEELEQEQQKNAQMKDRNNELLLEIYNRLLALENDKN